MKDRLQEMIEKYQKRIKEWDGPIYSMVQERLDDLQQLQAEQPKQEACIQYCHSGIIDWVSGGKDWIYKAIKRYEELEDEPPHYSNFRASIEQNIPKQYNLVADIDFDILRDKFKVHMGYVGDLGKPYLKELISHLTPKTTVPKDGEVVEIRSFLRHGYCKCGTSNAKIYPYCRGCGAKIKRIY